MTLTPIEALKLAEETLTGVSLKVGMDSDAGRLIITPLTEIRATLRESLPHDKITLNEEQRLYVIPEHGGYSCLGFDVCRSWTRNYLAWMGEKGLDPLPYASLDAYLYYKVVSERASEYSRSRKLRCPIHLTPELIGYEGRRVEVVDNEGQIRRFRVGKSTGWAPCHLEMNSQTLVNGKFVKDDPSDDGVGGPAVMGAPFKSVKVVGGNGRV